MENYLIGFIVGIVPCIIVSLLLLKSSKKKSEGDFENRYRAKIDKEVEEKINDFELDANKTLKDRVKKQRKSIKKEYEADQADFIEEKESLDKRVSKFTKKEEQIHKRELLLEDKLEAIDKRDVKITILEQDIEKREIVVTEKTRLNEELNEKLSKKLSEVAEMTKEEAEKELLRSLDEELAEEQNKKIRKVVMETEEQAKEKAHEIIARATQRYAAEHTAETTVAKFELTDEEMKGRIIGKEGRNIRAFEQISGVDLIVDDTPNLITISCFDGVRREVAKQSLEALVLDGRIHPARIEEIFLRTQQDMDTKISGIGEDAAYEVEVSGLHPQIIKLLGKLQYRTSYGQNVLQHTKEVAYLSAAIAADLGFNPVLAKRCGLLHDIGKALDQEQEGSHPALGSEILKRFGEKEAVINAALAHHEGNEVTSIYTTIVAAADAISAARPGARRENIERYIKRLQQLEEIAIGHDGVMKAYAIQAGRELRVIVNNHKLDDRVLSKVARDIAKQIESEVAYPGEVRVTMIRETRASATAK